MTELKKLRTLPSVLNQRLVVGGPSITDPAERSRGYQLALVSHHRDKSALAEYVTRSLLRACGLPGGRWGALISGHAC